MTALHRSASSHGSSGLIWAGAALVAVVYLVHVHHYWFVGDDAFISFRYSANLAAGEGLVWNPGEYVEGYTNFLWVLIIAAGMRLGLQPELLSCVLGVLSGGAILLLLGRFSARQHGWLSPVVWLPLLALALSRSFSAWSTGGLATMFFALLIVAAQLRFVDENEDASRWIFGSAVLFTLATLTRPEGGLFTAVAGLAFLVQVVRGRRAFLDLVRWTLPWIVVVGSHFLWRHAYYGSWLPNTFHAKVNGVWLRQAIHYFEAFQDDYKLFFFAPFAILAVLTCRSFAHVYLGAGIAAHCAYLLAIGGDRFEFRFLVVVLPTAYWLIAEGLSCLVRLPSVDRPWRGTRAVALALGLALLATTFLGSIRPEATRMRHGIESIQNSQDYARQRIREGRILAGYIERGVLAPDLPFSAGGIGVLPYYTKWPTLDSRGLTDLAVARSKLERRGVIAHERHATPEYMRSRGIVVFDSLNNLVLHDDPMQWKDKQRKFAGQAWDLHAVRLGEHVMVFSTMVPEDEFRAYFEGFEVLY